MLKKYVEYLISLGVLENTSEPKQGDPYSP